jgi:hypothetical protein
MVEEKSIDDSVRGYKPSNVTFIFGFLVLFVISRFAVDRWVLSARTSEKFSTFVTERIQLNISNQFFISSSTTKVMLNSSKSNFDGALSGTNGVGI